MTSPTQTKRRLGPRSNSMVGKKSKVTLRCSQFNVSELGKSVFEVEASWLRWCKVYQYWSKTHLETGHCSLQQVNISFFFPFPLFLLFFYFISIHTTPVSRLIVVTIVNKAYWLWNLRKLFVQCFCYRCSAVFVHTTDNRFWILHRPPVQLILRSYWIKGRGYSSKFVRPLFDRFRAHRRQ